MRTPRIFKKYLKGGGRFVRNLLGLMMNESIRYHHIRYFEKQITEYREDSLDDIAAAPNYYAWLWLRSEGVFWQIRRFSFLRDVSTEDDLDAGYNNLLDRFHKKCRDLNLWNEDELYRMIEVVDKILELRHAIVHKGFPCVLPAASTTERPKPACLKERGRALFTDCNTCDVLSGYLDPRKFADIKKEFDQLEESMSRAPVPNIDLKEHVSVPCQKD